MLHKLEVKKSKRKNLKKRAIQPIGWMVRSHLTDQLPLTTGRLDFCPKFQNLIFSSPFTSNPFLLHPNLFLIIHGGF